jgi:hypothetical protein
VLGLRHVVLRERVVVDVGRGAHRERERGGGRCTLRTSSVRAAAVPLAATERALCCACRTLCMTYAAAAARARCVRAQPNPFQHVTHRVGQRVCRVANHGLTRQSYIFIPTTHTMGIAKFRRRRTLSNSARRWFRCSPPASTRAAWEKCGAKSDHATVPCRTAGCTCVGHATTARVRCRIRS